MSNAKKIESLKEEIAKLEAAELALNAMLPEERVAIELHSKFCRMNHTDMCGWFYGIREDIHDWAEYSHAEYLGKARKMTVLCEKHGMPVETAMEILGIVQ